MFHGRAARATLSLGVIALLALTARAADDETRFKPKAYTGKTLQDRTYQAPAYKPAEKPRSAGAPLKSATSGSWTTFKSAGGETGQRLSEAAPANVEPYVQRTQISVPTLAPDPSVVPEKKPFDDTGKRVAEDPYKAPEKPTEKNPLLKPHQGIKEPE